MEQSGGIGIDLGGTSIKYGLVGQNKKVYWNSKKPTKAQTSSQEVIDNILRAIIETTNQAKQLNFRVKSIGIGTPGLVKDNKTIIGGAYNIADWINIPLGNIVSEKMKLPVFVGNDADMMGIGEFAASQSASDDTVLFITLGTGIGGAIFIKGEIFTGHYGFGGELGVFPMLMNGEVVKWEDIASTSAMVNFYKKQCHNDIKDKVNGKFITKKYFEQEPLALQIIEKSSEYIALGLAGYINALNPKKVVIGGGISGAGEFFINKIKEKVKLFAIKECLDNVQIEPAKLGNKAGFIGAALFALKKINKN